MKFSDNSSAVLENVTAKKPCAALSSRSLKDKPSPKLNGFIPAKCHHMALKIYHHLLKVKVKTQGYHFGVFFCAVASGTVFLVNLIVTIWATNTYDIASGLGTIQDGSCNRTNSLATWLHLAINVLSTLLLGCSNYTMQCLASPTRKEIDRAHRQNKWLDIGVPSTRNLLRISRWRLALWCLIAMSSIPLHLLYNSAVFSTLSAREYSVFIVEESFLQGQPFTVSQLQICPYVNLPFSVWLQASYHIVRNPLPYSI